MTSPTGRDDEWPPRLQNIPVRRTKEGSQLREILRKALCGDEEPKSTAEYAEVEMRIARHMERIRKRAEERRG